MFCEGTCNAWVHRTCVGLNKQAYMLSFLKMTNLIYSVCPHCCMKQQSSVIEGSSVNDYIDFALKQMESQLFHHFRR